MSSNLHVPPRDDTLLLSAIYGNPRQRRILSILHDRSYPLPQPELAARIAASEADKPMAEVTATECETVAVSLHHNELPKLEAAGVIERRDGGIVATGAAGLDGTALSLPELLAADQPSVAAVSAVLADPRREAILSVLDDGSTTLQTLADELVSREESARYTEPTDDERALLARLHHIDLPKLDDVGVVEYDVDEKTVSPDTAFAAAVDLLGEDASEDEGITSS